MAKSKNRSPDVPFPKGTVWTGVSSADEIEARYHLWLLDNRPPEVTRLVLMELVRREVNKRHTKRKKGSR